MAGPALTLHRRWQRGLRAAPGAAAGAPWAGCVPNGCSCWLLALAPNMEGTAAALDWPNRLPNAGVLAGALMPKLNAPDEAAGVPKAPKAAPAACAHSTSDSCESTAFPAPGAWRLPGRAACAAAAALARAHCWRRQSWRQRMGTRRRSRPSWRACQSQRSTPAQRQTRAWSCQRQGSPQRALCWPVRGLAVSAQGGVQGWSAQRPRGPPGQHWPARS